jgi:hypothetical protein
MAALVLPYTPIVCTFTFWDGGWAPPARFAAVILPMLSAYVALALQRAPLPIVRGFAVAAAVYTATLTTLAIFTPHGGFTTGASQHPGLPPMFTAWTAATIGPPQPYGCSAGDSNTARTTRPRPPEPSQTATPTARPHHRHDGDGQPVTVSSPTLNARQRSAAPTQPGASRH